MEDNKDNEVYFLGKQHRHRHHKWLWVAIVILLLAVPLGIASLWSSDRDSATIGKTLKGEVLQTVSVLPEGAAMPKFNGDGDINDFYVWLTQNLKYPQGLENEQARVVISFVVQTDGKLGQFKVIDSTKQKAFEDQVIDLLKQSPAWTPARLSDGQEVNMEFTLPVLFALTENRGD